jgi:hypothetical protein
MIPLTESSFGEFPVDLVESDIIRERLRSQLCHKETFRKDFGPVDLPLNIAAFELI